MNNKTDLLKELLNFSYEKLKVMKTAVCYRSGSVSVDIYSLKYGSNYYLIYNRGAFNRIFSLKTKRVKYRFTLFDPHNIVHLCLLMSFLHGDYIKWEPIKEEVTDVVISYLEKLKS